MLHIILYARYVLRGFKGKKRGCPKSKIYSMIFAFWKNTSYPFTQKLGYYLNKQ